MKYGILLLVAFCASCWVASGEVSQDRLKDLKKLVQIDRVKDSEHKNSAGKCVDLRIDFSSDQEGLEDVFARVAVELTDKVKKTYWVEASKTYPADFGENYTGEGYWMLMIPYGSFDKLKVSAFAVEFGVMDGDKFVPFDAVYDGVKTFDELIARTTTPFPGECKFGYTYMVDSLDD